VPSTWELSSLNGTVEVENSSAATEAVVVIPALETSGVTPASFFNSSLAYVEKQTRSGGSTINVTTGTSSNGTPDASFTARVNGVNLAGKASVSVLPLITKLATAEVVFKAYWAPAAQLASDESMLSSIGSCYGPERATLFRVFQDQVFTYVMPPGWTVSGENQNGIILNLGDTADVTYLLLEVVPASESGSALGLIKYYLNSAGIENVHSISVTSSPSQTESNGEQQQTAYEEFTGTVKGVFDHGLIYCLADTGSDGLTSGVVRMAFSTQASWNGLNSGLIQMAGFIQHNFTQDLEQLAALNREWQQFSGQVEDFDDVLNEQQLVRDPATGVYYEAPYSSYDPDGPDGPGYYTSDGDPLEPVSRS
jgi:hypothetical protein